MNNRKHRHCDATKEYVSRRAVLTIIVQRLRGGTLSNVNNTDIHNGQQFREYMFYVACVAQNLQNLEIEGRASLPGPRRG